MGQPQPAMTDTPPSLATFNHDDEDEWEYEYDPYHTEDVYFTLDLTTHVPDALLDKEGLDTSIDQKSQWNSATAGNKPIEEVQQASPEEGSGDDNDDDNDAHLDSLPKLQLLDLHTNNPLVRFNDGYYSCYWTTDLGTQFHVAQATEVPNARHPGTVLDVVALSQTRLIGKPVTLKRRDGTSNVASQNSNSETADAANPIEIDDDGESNTNETVAPVKIAPIGTPGEPLVIPRVNCKTLAAERQAIFLERLSRIKLKKGENDPVPMYNIKIYKEPADKEEIRERGEAAEDLRRQQAKDDALAAKMERPRKRRKRLTAAERGIVLPEGTIINYGGRPARIAIASSVGYDDGGSPAPIRYGGKQGREEIAAMIGYQDEAPNLGLTRWQVNTVSGGSVETNTVMQGPTSSAANGAHGSPAHQEDT